jgi:hypothetical protein
LSTIFLSEVFDAKRKNIAKEIRDTERTFVRGLSLLVSVGRCSCISNILKVYVDPLTASHLLKHKHLEKLFTLQYSEVLRNFHMEFLQLLHERIESWTTTSCIGDLFIAKVARKA